MGDPVMTIDNVGKRFGERSVLEHISFTVDKGDMLVIIGPNGAGKSTLLRILMGFDAPSSGSVRVGGKKPADMRTRFAYVPQRFHFDRTTPVTVEEFLRLSAHVSGLHDHESHDRIEQRLHDVGLAHSGDQLLSSLSGGQLQRIMIARALLTERPFLFLDEPVAGIDIEGQQTMYDLITAINRDHGTTCIMISHELDVVYRYANRVLCVNKRMLCHGPPREAMTEQVLKEMYGGNHGAHYHHDEHKKL